MYQADHETHPAHGAKVTPERAVKQGMSRWQAALIHFGISVLVAAIATGLLLFVWYPPPYFAAGGGELLLLIVGVDITLGPLLTLIVFKSGKPSLKFDLSVIALLQAAALVYGFHVMLQSRPVFIVSVVDRLVMVSADDIAADDLAKAGKPEWRHLSWTGPVLVGSEIPSDTEASNDLLFSALDGKDIDSLPEYYVPYAQTADAMMQKARPLSDLHPSDPAMREKLAALLRDAKRDGREVRYLPLQRHSHYYTALIDLETKRPYKVLDLDPWEAGSP